MPVLRGRTDAGKVFIYALAPDETIRPVRSAHYPTLKAGAGKPDENRKPKKTYTAFPDALSAHVRKQTLVCYIKVPGIGP